MDWLEPIAAVQIAGLLELVVVYAVSLVAALYLVRTIVRVFRPARRRAGGPPVESGGGCASCKGCGSTKA